ncbi:hypothetical protein [Microbacterium sp. GCM10011525]|uniref:hypothetical protein n=1 Tax=Microbacterium sp. GCM10011525 TaxID=3317335 RepID=UPI0012FBFFF6|nr:hypothetical protein [Microbacterium sp. MAH-37]
MRRAGVHVGRLSLVAVIVALLVAGIGGLDAVAERMIADGSARMLTDAEPDARTMRVVAQQAADAGAQDAAVRDAVASAFSGADVVITRQVSAVVHATFASERTFELGLLDDVRVPGLAALADGAWPESAEQIALPVAAAERRGLAVGDTITKIDPLQPAAGSVELALVGTWTPDDAADPAWHGDPSVVSGENDGVIGPAFTVADALDGLPDPPSVTWEVAPESTDLAELPALISGVTKLRAVPEVVDPDGDHDMDVIGGLGATLQRQAAAVAGTRGLLVAPLLIIALLGLLVLGIVLAMLAAARAEEIVLLRARGASRRSLAVGAAAEALIFGAAGALVALAGLVLTVGAGTTALLIAAGAALVPALLSALFTARITGGGASVRADASRSDAGLRTLPVLLVPALAAVALAAFATWQLFATGSVVRADGAPDPLAAAAPALMLIAACTLVPVIAAPLAALAERALRRTRGIAPILPLRQIARRMGGTAVAILCLALAAASIALAAAAPVAAGAAEQRTRFAVLGGDVRLITDEGLDTTAAEAAEWSGVTSAAEILRTPLAIGADTVDLLAGPSEALGFTGSMDTGSANVVGAELTRSLADRLGAQVGTVFTAQVRFAAQPVSIQVLRIVDALPGIGSGWGVAADPERLRAAGVRLAADELWLDSADPVTVASLLRTQATHPVRILTEAQVSATPVTSVASTVLTAGALIAAMLGVAGFFAATSAMSRSRREEPLVLRALGLRRSQQRTLRVGETTGVAGYALIAGALLGTAVAVVVLPIVLGLGS